MAFERMREGHVLDEGDVVEVLRKGRTAQDYAREMALRGVPGRSSYEELVESSALRCRQALTPPGTGGIRYDAVSETIDDARSVLREERLYEARRQRDARYAYRAIRMIRDACERLDQDTRALLTGYYTEGKSVGELTARFGCSESTFWRRRRRGIDAILESCRRMEGQMRQADFCPEIE